jgi:histidyl-tRNA synthetase
MDRALLPAYLELVCQLRAAGLNAELFLKPKAKLGDQLRYASDWQIPFAVIMGSDEAARECVTVKDLEAGKSASEGLSDRSTWVSERPGQFEIRRDELIARLKGLLSKP